MISKHDLEDHIYSGYAIPIQQFSDLLRQIPSYREVMDRSKFTTNDTHLCYRQWKRDCIPREGRKKAPHIMVYWDGDDDQTEGGRGGARGADEDEDDTDFKFELTHVLILIRAIPFKEEAQLDDPNHEDAPKVRLEKETDRLARERFVKFFRSQGANDMKTEDFVYTWSLLPHPSLIMN